MPRASTFEANAEAEGTKCQYLRHPAVPVRTFCIVRSRKVVIGGQLRHLKMQKVRCRAEAQDAAANLQSGVRLRRSG